MKLLIIAGSANDVFINRMVIELKRKNGCLDIDVFEFYPTNKQKNDTEKYANVYSPDYSSVLCQLPKLGKAVRQLYANKYLCNFIESRQYDFIHCHWIVAPLVSCYKLKLHCKKLYATFWGGEMTAQSLYFSKSLYRKKLQKFMSYVDVLVGSEGSKMDQVKIFPQFENNYQIAKLAPISIEWIYKMMQYETKNESKGKLGICESYYTVLIGYSGKVIHQHLNIINELCKHPKLKQKIFLIAPMNRGGYNKYIEEVEMALKASGFKFLLTKGTLLSDEEMARLRNATDITLQLSTRDGFSRSIVECLCAKSVLIYGQWLNYTPYFECEGFSATKASDIKDAISQLEEIVENFDNYKSVVDRNSINGRQNNLWSTCIENWAKLYE